MSLTRKQFIQTSLALAAVGVLPSCSDDETDTGSGSPSSGSGASGNGGSGASGSGGSGAGPGQGGGGAGPGQGGGGAGPGQGGGGQGGTGGTGGNPTAQCAGGADVTIQTQHMHELVVSEADIDAGVDKPYTVTGRGHTHALTVTAADFATLAGGGTVMLTAGPGGQGDHTHMVTLVCA